MRKIPLPSRYTAFLLGLCATLAFPPFYLLPFAAIGFSGLLLLLFSCTTKKQAFLTGWWFGFGHFTTGIYWIAFALLTDAAQFGWMVPFAVFGIAAVLALYVAAVTLCTYSLPLKSPTSKVIAFGMLWLGGEYARTYLLSGFPWNLIGYVWTFSDTMVQSASVLGIYGMGFITILTAASLAPCVAQYTLTGKILPATMLLPGILLMVIALGAGWGSYRLAHATDATVDGVTLRLVQGNIKQSLKWEPKQREQHVQKYIDLTRSPGFNTITHVIWPETALPYVIQKDNPGLHEILRYVTPPNGALLTGAIRMEGTDYNYQVWNSFFVMTREQDIYTYYDKFHLVPFGEYIPLRFILPSFIHKITQGAKDFSTGPGPTAIALPHAPPLLPLICYEAIFPQYSNGNIRGEYAWILNITNDAWFGKSTGPYQHLNMVRMRAVEQGVPLVRAANTGISVVTDPYGRVRAKIPLNETGIIDTPLPAKLIHNTIFNMYGGYIILSMLAWCGMLVIIIEKIHTQK